MSGTILTVVEDISQLPQDCINALLWESFEERQGVLSIPKIVEEEISELRSDYLNWTENLAYSSFNGATLSEHLTTDLLDGGSYWWQTLVADKSPYKTKAVYDVLRVRVIEKRFIEGGYNHLIYIGANKKVARVLGKWLTQLGHTFTWQRVKIQNRSALQSTGGFYQALPLIFQAGIYLVHIIVSRLRFSNHVKPDPAATCTIVTYFPGIDLKKAEECEFYSNYWGPLTDLLKQEKIPVNWIWMYSNMHQLSYKESVSLQSRLNTSVTYNGSKFLFIEDFIDIKSFCKGLVFYFKLFCKKYFLLKAHTFFSFPGSRLNFFHILKDDWDESFSGHSAISTCMQMSAFSSMSKKLPAQTDLVLYVWENQPWEQSLLAIKKKLPNAFFVGSVHTPANCALYNLKVFPGKAIKTNMGNERRLFPDLLAAPGDKSRQMLVQGGWPENIVQTFEALRYITSLQPIQYFGDKGAKKEYNLLVVTGSIQTETEIQIQLLSLAEKKGALKKFTQIIIKPHPLIPVENMVEKANFQTLNKIVYQPLSKLWGDAHVVYTSNSTSVSLEAAYHGIPVIIVGASGNLNINALFGTEDVEFIHTVDELCKKLSLFPAEVKPKKDFFELNPALSKWADLFRKHGFPHTNDLKFNHI